MSRENPSVAVTVTGKLEGKKNYDPQLTLRIWELWGTSTVPDDYVISEEQLSAMSSLVIDDGDYTLSYTFDNRFIKKPVRVAGGRLLAHAA
jgi:hypothetical protein